MTGLSGSVVLSSNNAVAQVSGGLSMADASVTLVDQELQRIRVDVDASYEVSANVSVDSVECEMHIGTRASSLDMIARQTEPVTIPDDGAARGDMSLSGSVGDAADFRVSEMVPETGSVDHTALAELRVFVIRDDEVLSEAIVRDTWTMTITKEEVTVTTEARGSGSVTFETG